MKILLQVGVVFGVFWLSQCIEAMLPFPFPASVISLLLLLILLLLRIVKVERIREMADFLLGNLGFFFVPVAVGIMNYVDVIWENAAAFFTICVVSTVVTYGATAWTVRLTSRLLAKKERCGMSALVGSPFFGITLTVIAYALGVKAQKKTGLVICNNMIISVALLVAVLLVFHIPYEAYYQGGSLINMLLGPATACMAVNIYAKKDLLKKNWLPVLAGCIAGVVASVGSILLMSRLFGLDKAMTASLLPKSVTTPIATAISGGHGGIVSITVAAVICTGILGNLIAPLLRKLFRVEDPLAVGLGIGACSHAIGTAKALEMGETEGAMSGLAIGLCGIITAVLALGFEAFL